MTKKISTLHELISCGAIFLFILFLPLFASAEKTTPAEPALVNEQIITEKMPHAKKMPSSSGEVSTAAFAGIATLTIFADPTASVIGSSGLSFDLGTHAFITVKNISTSNITVGKISGIAPGKTVSIGTWGNKTEHKGLWYNLESYLVYYQNAYPGRISYSSALTSATLDTLNTYIKYIKNNDYWSNTTNCSSFATGAWNSSVATTDRLSAGIPNTPKNLANNIKSKWPTQYRSGLSVPYNYVVYFAQGASTPVKSSVYK